MLPLALGFGTRRIAATLAALLLSEAIFVWIPSLRKRLVGLTAAAGPTGSDATAGGGLGSPSILEHLTVNLAIVGTLLLLTAFGSGRYSLDQLIKKID